MSASCEVTLTIPFHDLDPLHVVWHGNYYKYFDTRFAQYVKADFDFRYGYRFDKYNIITYQDDIL